MKRQVSVSARRSNAKRQKTSPIPRNFTGQYAIRPSTVDYKINDYNAIPAVVTTAGTILPLNQFLIRGANYVNEFIGKLVTPVGFQCKWNLSGAFSNVFLAADLNNVTRFILFQWDDNSVPTLADIVQDVGAPWQSGINFDKREKLTILKDWQVSTWCTNTNGITAITSSNSHSGKFYIKGNKMSPIKYNSNPFSIEGGGFYMLVVSDSSIAPNPTYNFYTRMTFTD